jgi:hypothetical protein
MLILLHSVAIVLIEAIVVQSQTCLRNQCLVKMEEEEEEMVAPV